MKKTYKPVEIDLIATNLPDVLTVISGEDDPSEFNWGQWIPGAGN